MPQTDLSQFIQQSTLTKHLELDQETVVTKSTPLPTTVDANNSAEIEELQETIKDRKARLAELQKEIDDAKRDAEGVIESERDLKPEDDDECLFDCYGPTAEAEWHEIEFQNQTEIALLKLEIGELEAKLQHLRGEQVI